MKTGRNAGGTSKEGVKMRLMKMATLVLLVGMAHAVVGDSCIVSGSIERSPASVKPADSLETFESRSRAVLAATPLPTFESRVFAALAGILQDFRSDAPTPLVIFVR